MYPVSLRLSGFKSFAEPTEIVFAEGMSAVVGPNGCGKSNIVEALRWVMGEGSARQLRGTEMDEMIFGGSSERPPFSRAEVTLTLENPLASPQETEAKRAAKPTAGSEATSASNLQTRLRDERRIALSRRIETGGGSTYRINGKEVLARDVQTLCADIGLGADASAIIAQGRVASLVEAKPSERRQLIEEAAGVRGLYARRSEALSSMDNTQAILTRVEDRSQEIEKQLHSLNADEERAERYRNLSRQIKRWQAADFAREQEALEKMARAIESRQKAREQQSEQGRIALAKAEATTLEAEQQKSAAEKCELESAARCQSLAQDIALLERSLKESEQRKKDVQQRQHDNTRLRDEQQRALEEVEGMWLDAQKQTQAGEAGETDKTQPSQDKSPDKNQEKNQEKNDAGLSSAHGRKKSLSALTQELGTIERRLKQLASTLSDFDRKGAIYSERLAASRSQKEQLQKELEKLAEKIDKKMRTQDSQKDSQENFQEDSQEDSQKDSQESAHAKRTQEALPALREELRQAEAHAQETQSKTLPRLRREEEALLQEREQSDARHRAHHLVLTAERDKNRDLYREASSSFAQASPEREKEKKQEKEKEKETEGNPLVVDWNIPEGLARALFGALGEDLFASLEDKRQQKGASVWRVWKTLPLPAGTSSALPALSSLSDKVVSFADLFADAPAPLRARLACIGLVESARDGEDLQGKLSCGQRLVARDGSCWRWDGLATSAELAAALEQRFRAFLQKEKRREALAKSEADLAQAARDDGERTEGVARRLSETRERMRAALEEQMRHGKGLQELRKRLRIAEALAQEQERYHARQTRLAFDLDDARAKELSAEQGLQELVEREQMAGEQARLTSRRELLLDEQRSLLAEQQREQASQVRARDEQRARVANEQRLRALKERQHQLLQRSIESMRTLESEASTLEERPLREQKMLLEKRALHQRAQAEHRERTNAFETASRRVAQLREQLRSHIAHNAEAEKEAVRLQTQAEPLPLARQRLAARVQEEMDCSLEELPRRYDLDASFLSESPEIQKAARRASQDKRARLGEINFTAKQVLQTLSEEHEQTQRHHADVAEALEKLRQSVHTLEQEAAGKLVRVQQEAGARFATLIERLFGGGEAKLFFSDPEDPITSGLEIRIALPGKRLKSLSVLSGGEQALVAIALVLAVFSVAGGGFCILDEVDAALDDTNVSRFCDLIEDIATQHETRFLVITHHRHTMSRALRLYGVAMPEPGCSRIVSVALDEAVEQARPAAE